MPLYFQSSKKHAVLHQNSKLFQYFSLLQSINIIVFTNYYIFKVITSIIYHRTIHIFMTTFLSLSRTHPYFTTFTTFIYIFVFDPFKPLKSLFS